MADEVVLTSLRDVESLRFFHVVCHRDSAARRLGIDSVRKTFDAWLDGYGSPRQIYGETGINGFQPIVTEYLPELLCLSIQCPFDDVREALADILDDVKVGTDTNKGELVIFRVASPPGLAVSKASKDTELLLVALNEADHAPVAWQHGILFV